MLLSVFVGVLGMMSLCAQSLPEGFGATWAGFPLDNKGDSSPKTESSFYASVKSYEVGKPIELIWSLSYSGGWHAYYRNPGTVGLPPEVSLKAPKGFLVEGPYWSIPQIGKTGQDVYYGSDNPQFMWRVTPTTQAPALATFDVTGSWQLCGAEGCLPPSEPVSETLSLEKGEAMPSSALVSGNFPLPWEESFWATHFVVSAQKTSTGVDLVFLEKGMNFSLNGITFFSDTGDILPTAPQLYRERKNAQGEREYVLTLVKNKGENSLYPSAPLGSSLKGMLVFERDNGEKSGALIDIVYSGEGVNAVGVSGRGSLPLNSVVLESEVLLESSSLWQILLALFVGGLILNLMPCVFPVIGLKVMSFVDMAGGARRKVVLHSLWFVIGVVVSFWIITTLLVLLKGSVPHINWAFWLESPWVLLVLFILMLTMGLNMFGVFEIGVSATSLGSNAQQKKGYAGSFYSGVLATVVATPCSAPFLGASMGPAMALPVPSMYLAFTCMGLGMALPYLILGIFPSLVKFLPRPGAWMESLKQGLSFLLFGTAAWLLWTYESFFADAEPLATLGLLFGIVIFAMGGWIKGRWDLPYKSLRVQWIARLLVISCLGISLYMMLPPALKTSDTVAEASKLTWGTWSPEAEKLALEAGRPVFVDFTARWCATCQVNKSVAYSDEVAKIVKEYGVVLLKADKTKTNSVIDAELKKLGRTAVPVNVLYLPHDPVPHITDVNLTSSYLSKFLLDLLSKKG